MTLFRSYVGGVLLTLSCLVLTTACSGGFEAKIPKGSDDLFVKPAGGGSEVDPNANPIQGEERTPEQQQTASEVARAFISATELSMEAVGATEVTAETVEDLAKTFSTSASDHILGLTVSKELTEVNVPADDFGGLKLREAYDIEVQTSVRVNGEIKYIIFGGNIHGQDADKEPEVSRLFLFNVIEDLPALEASQILSGGQVLQQPGMDTRGSKVSAYVACKGINCEQLLLMIQIKTGDDIYKDIKGGFILQTVENQNVMEIVSSSVREIRSFDEAIGTREDHEVENVNVSPSAEEREAAINKLVTPDDGEERSLKAEGPISGRQAPEGAPVDFTRTVQAPDGEIEEDVFVGEEGIVAEETAGETNSVSDMENERGQKTSSGGVTHSSTSGSVTVELPKDRPFVGELRSTNTGSMSADQIERQQAIDGLVVTEDGDISAEKEEPKLIRPLRGY